MITRIRNAFTLVELLVVITIIGVLMGLLIPVVNKVREFGRAAQCMSNLKQLHQAVANYAQENSRSMPYSASSEAQDDDTPRRWYQNRYGWVNWRLIPYPSPRPAAQPGGDKRTYWWGVNGTICITNGTLFAYAKDVRIYLCPTFARRAVCGRSDPVRSYVMNRAVSGGEITMRGAPRTILFADGGLHAYPVPGSSANRLADYGLRGQTPGDWNNYGGDWAWSGQYYRQLDGELMGTKAGANNWPLECIGTYHNGKGNAVFVDGHCEKLPLAPPAGTGNIRFDTTNACSGAWGT